MHTIVFLILHKTKSEKKEYLNALVKITPSKSFNHDKILKTMSNEQESFKRNEIPLMKEVGNLIF